MPHARTIRSSLLAKTDGGSARLTPPTTDSAAALASLKTPMSTTTVPRDRFTPELWRRPGRAQAATVEARPRAARLSVREIGPMERGTPSGSRMIDDLWYKNAIVYSLSVATFMDANGDGVGDFEGLMRRLDY